MAETRTNIATVPSDTSVTVAALGDEYVVTVMHRHADGVRAFTCTARTPKGNTDLRALEHMALTQTREWVDTLAAKLSA